MIVTRAVVCAVVTVTTVVASPTAAWAQRYRTRVIATGLERPLGIAVEGSEDLYFTEVPEPGVAGGRNGVSHLDLESGTITTISQGEPEPTHLAVGRDGDIYWTCKSAGVILARLEGGSVGPFATGLKQPSGIAVGGQGAVYFTEIPTPGVPGGRNRVSVIRGDHKRVISMGEPEPVDVAVARNGDLYWTCKTAGVILTRHNGTTSVLLSGLDSPVGIAIDHRSQYLYFTEVPTPGVSGANGGRNKVRRYSLESGELLSVNEGDPEPTDVAVARNGNVYWTCTSAGVIVEARRTGGRH
jgi:DNA-binding beta-propeller fold protein YncE